MSRSGYSDDCDGWALIRWRGAVNSAIRGERGQKLLRELAASLDAMPVKELVAHEFEAHGQFCALGTVGAVRGMNLAALDPEDRDGIASAFGIAPALAAEIMDLNDMVDAYGMYYGAKTVADMDAAERGNRQKRWHRVRQWVQQHINPATQGAT